MSTSAAQKVKEEPYVLPRNARKLREQDCNTHIVYLPPRVTDPKQLEERTLWGTISADLRDYDEIHCVAYDRSWFAVALVTYATPGRAEVEVLSVKRLRRIEAPGERRCPDTHEIFLGSPDEGWVIRRKTDGVFIGTGFGSHEDALRHLLDHASVRAR